MPITAAGKKGHYKAGKSLVLLFNRVSMYGVGHPFSVHAVDECHKALLELLRVTAPVVLIHARGQFFLEDEPLDPSLNVSKMSAHFKKAAVSSVSIESDVARSDLEDFIRVLLDTRTYPSADPMRRALAARGVTRIRINHIFYQKVTEDDEVVSREVAERSSRLDRELDSSREAQDALGLIAGKLLSDEIGRGAELQALLADPSAFVQGVLPPAPGAGSAAGPDGAEGGAPGWTPGRLEGLRAEVRSALSAGSGASLARLAESLVKMRSELLAQIDARKALGLAVDGEAQIREAAADLSDLAVIELIRKEYDHGRTPVDRLAFILHRLVPDSEDMARLLPALRTALTADGMPGEDFMALLGRLGLDRREDQAIEALREGADAIGVDPADLLGRLTSDPAGFARILYLASEIEREAGSRKPLSDILVEHLERVGAKLASDGAGSVANETDRLPELVRRFHARALDGLRVGGVDPEMITQVERRLTERLEASVQAIRSELAARVSGTRPVSAPARTLLQNLEDGLPEDHELRRVLAQVRAGLAERGDDENDSARILQAIEQAREAVRKPEKTIDEIVFGRKHTVALLEIEIARALRYGTDLCGIVFSIYRGAAPAGSDAAPTVDTTVVILTKLREKLRNTDWIGILNGKLFIAVLPMTTPKEAHLASRRLLKSLNAAPAVVGGRSVPFKLAGSVAHFDRSRMADPDAFVRHAQAGHTEMVHRLRNLQDFM